MLTRARDADIGQPTLFLEPLHAAFIQAAAGWEDFLFPAGQEDDGPFQPFGAVQGQDLHLVFPGPAGRSVHDQFDMFQEAGQ